MDISGTMSDHGEPNMGAPDTVGKEYFLRTATVSDLPTIMRHRRRMFADLGFRPTNKMRLALKERAAEAGP